MIPLVGGAEGGGVLPPVRAEIAVDGGVAFGLLVPMDQAAGVAGVTAAPKTVPPAPGALALPALAVESAVPLSEVVSADTGDGGRGMPEEVSVPDGQEPLEQDRSLSDQPEPAPLVDAIAANPVVMALPAKSLERLQLEGGGMDPAWPTARDGGDWQEDGQTPAREDTAQGGREDGRASPVKAGVAVAEVPLIQSARDGDMLQTETVSPDIPREGEETRQALSVFAPPYGPTLAEQAQVGSEADPDRVSFPLAEVQPAQGVARGPVGKPRATQGVEGPPAKEIEVGNGRAVAAHRDIPVPADVPGRNAPVPPAEGPAQGKDAVPLAPPDRTPAPCDPLLLMQSERPRDAGEAFGHHAAWNRAVRAGDLPPDDLHEGMGKAASAPAPAASAVPQASGGVDQGLADRALSGLPSGDVASERRLPIIAAPPHAHALAVERFAALPPTVPAALVAQARAGEAGPVTVTLSPEELGILRFEMHGRGEAIHVALVVERPETLDLLRRHAEQLAGEFRQAGFAGASFSFSGGQAGAGGGAERWGASVRLWQGGEEEAVTLPKARRAGTGAGLNLLL